jgi:hypothetical protein
MLRLHLVHRPKLTAHPVPPSCTAAPQDPVYSIRDAAIHVLQAVAKEFGPDWAREHIVPQVGWRWPAQERQAGGLAATGGCAVDLSCLAP